MHCAVTPPSTFGVFFVNHFALPGSTRSGEKHRKKSLPTDSPFDSKRGSISSRVVPGYVVDSSTTICPGRSRSTIASVAATMYDMSGSFVFPSGVGTQTEMTSHSPRRDMSVVASSFPERRSDATSAPFTSLMWLSPAFTSAATRSETSKPMTLSPARPISTASGSPT